jgi:MoxR-like ATPase
METSTAAPVLSLQDSISQLQAHLNQRIIGQQKLITRLLIALLTDGHLLVEGAPGLAKTRAIKELSACIEGDFHRIQFTPDLLPADLTGTEVYRQQLGNFDFRPGPLFHNLVLADEINRAPAKVQSALLEAMAERQITVGSVTYSLPDLFLVMATQNPIEQEGTYPLPEAQLDRFLMQVKIDYPDTESERAILALNRLETAQKQRKIANTHPTIPQEIIFNARHAILNLHLSPQLEEYIVQLVMATRNPAPYGSQLAKWVQYGASPRATIALDLCSRAHAWLQGRDYVSPEDIHAITHDVLRHRIYLSYAAEAEGIDSDLFIKALLDRVAIP